MLADELQDAATGGGAPLEQCEAAALVGLVPDQRSRSTTVPAGSAARAARVMSGKAAPMGLPLRV